jgi:hypothetical protein
MTHTALHRLGVSETEYEIVGSQRMLEDGLGRRVTSFAFPYGLASAASHRQVAAHYRGACSTELGTARQRHDRHWLPRIEMYYFRKPPLCRLVGSSLGAGYLRLRAVGRKIRSALQRCGDVHPAWGP